MANNINKDCLPVAITPKPISILTEEVKKSRGHDLDPNTTDYIDEAIEDAIDERIVTEGS